MNQNPTPEQVEPVVPAAEVEQVESVEFTLFDAPKAAQERPGLL